MRRGLIGGVVLAALWFVCGWAPFLLQPAGGSLATLAQAIPSPMRYGMFGLPVPWAIVVQVLIGAVLIAGYAVLATRLAPGNRGSFAAGWLAAILSAFVIGASLDLGDFFVWVGQFGIRGALGTMGAAPLTVWWAVLVGWIPALVVSGRRAERAEAAAAQADSAEAAAAENVRSPEAVTAAAARFGASRTVVAATAVAVVAAIALPFAAEAGHAAAQDQLRQEQAAAQVSADPDGAAPPDPTAAGDPVPTVAPTGIELPEGACTAENTTILAPAADAATGHRGQLLQLVNTSDEPCVVDGYPDVAYGDQNGHLLAVTVEHGSSFMAQDPGPQPLTVQPGDTVFAVIGWDANSVHGQLAARSLWVAVHPGAARLTWEVSLDIIPGTTVEVTAWQVRNPAGG
ncbi:DUF4232 domain-containing protein [Microbacterium hibisci]|uniref:DUF4232 domain-containing protein n=1 Tax=Microbacterium hibisci TaxID=2036000 RepID=UPI001941874C|nr:DUF4232 domain-containing protein [Microbacterium hibisci]